MKKVFQVVYEFFLMIGFPFYFIVIHIIGCKLITFRQKEYIKEFRITNNSYEFTIFKGKIRIGSIFFTDAHINMRTSLCDIRKGVINRDKVAIGYIDGFLVILIFEQVRELFRAKCSKKEFNKLEEFLWIDKSSQLKK